jgi:DNA-binding NtrC family response regulator
MTAHILMVDDEPDAQDLFRQNFRREIRNGLYQIEFAQSGDAALEVLRHGAEPVSLVLSDINMPGKSGIELLSDIRRIWPDMTVMMITAYGDQNTQAKVRALGANEFLTKPVDFDALKQAVSQVIEKTA